MDHLLRIITSADTPDVGRVQAIDLYYRDLARADQTPREIMYLHLGMLIGICLRLLKADRVS